MKPDPRCLIDPTIACHRCLADSPITCPYRYLLGTDAMAHRAEVRDRALAGTPEHAGGTP